MPTLGLNIDHVATIRQARRIAEPDPIHAAAIAQAAGVHGIVAHLREDRRHINDRDIRLLNDTVHVKFNMEMAVTEEIVNIALDVCPDTITLVPEKREELTTEGGLDVAGNFKRIKDVVGMASGKGIVSSLFIDADYEQIKASKETGAEWIEIHTGTYCEMKTEKEQLAELEKIQQSVSDALGLGLRVAAGHGLNYLNVEAIAEIEGVEELNIGHSIIGRAVLVGLERAVMDMIDLIS